MVAILILAYTKQRYTFMLSSSFVCDDYMAISNLKHQTDINQTLLWWYLGGLPSKISLTTSLSSYPLFLKWELFVNGHYFYRFLSWKMYTCTDETNVIVHFDCPFQYSLTFIYQTKTKHFRFACLTYCLIMYVCHLACLMNYILFLFRSIWIDKHL